MKFAAVPFLLVAALLCGCASVEVSKEGGHHMVCVKNTGWHFLNMLALASGNVQHPNTCSTKFFSDTVTLQNNIRMLDKHVEKSGARGFRHLSSSRTEESIFFMLFSRSIMHTSAELVFDGAHAE